jgi:hypothetical protein
MRKVAAVRRLSLDELEDESEIPSPSLTMIRPELEAIKALAAQEDSYFGQMSPNSHPTETSPGKASEDYKDFSSIIRSFSSF